MTKKARYLVVPILSCALACSMFTPAEPAPLQGGESLTYETYISTSPARITITFAKTSDGFAIESKARDPEAVGVNLRHGRRRIRTYELDLLWLTPSERQIGAKNHLGTVTEETSVGGRRAFVLNERDGAVRRFFDAETGFLLRRERAGTVIGLTTLVSSTIPGL